MKVITISGHAGSGKDTAAQMLAKYLKERNRTSIVMHYADLLKFICKTYLGWNGEKDEAGRKLLQEVGTEVIRKEDPDFWVDFICRVLHWFGSEWDYVLIPDARFPNEINKLKDDGFSVTHLRMIRENYDTNLTDEQKTHPSETALDNVTPDRYIKNNHSLEVLDIYMKALASMIDDEDPSEGDIYGNYEPQ